MFNLTSTWLAIGNIDCKWTLSFSMYFLYSSMVVAPMTCQSDLNETQREVCTLDCGPAIHPPYILHLPVLSQSILVSYKVHNVYIEPTWNDMKSLHNMRIQRSSHPSLQLATRQRRLHDISSINGTTTITCTTRTNDGVDLILKDSCKDGGSITDVTLMFDEWCWMISDALVTFMAN